MKQINQHNKMLGWREWVGLPELAIPLIKAKVDTGARTSALHAFFIESFTENSIEYVRFGIHPIQKNSTIKKECVVPILDRRMVTDSGGHQEERIVIQTPVLVGAESWPIEITLTNRDSMKFRMLLGRTAIAGRYHIATETSYRSGKPDSTLYSSLEQGFSKPL